MAGAVEQTGERLPSRALWQNVEKPALHLLEKEAVLGAEG